MTGHVMIFASIHDVMAAEHALHGAGVWCDMIPTPRPLSSDCGMAIKVRPDDLEKAREIIASRPIRLEAVYKHEGDRYVEVT